MSQLRIRPYALDESLYSATVGTGRRHPMSVRMPSETSTAKKRATLDMTLLHWRLQSAMAQLNIERDLDHRTSDGPS